MNVFPIDIGETFAIFVKSANSIDETPRGLDSLKTEKEPLVCNRREGSAEVKKGHDRHPVNFSFVDDLSGFHKTGGILFITLVEHSSLPCMRVKVNNVLPHLPPWTDTILKLVNTGSKSRTDRRIQCPRNNFVVSIFEIDGPGILRVPIDFSGIKFFSPLGDVNQSRKLNPTGAGRSAMSSFPIRLMVVTAESPAGLHASYGSPSNPVAELEALSMTYL